MKLAIILLLSAATIACAVELQAKASADSKYIVVESPSNLPGLAQSGGADMYLHDTNDGQTYLYIESNSGAELSILNVTDPASIRGVAQVSISAAAPFDFVRDINQAAVLIRYRDNSGFAILHFAKYNRPMIRRTPQWAEIRQTPQLAAADVVENLGSAGLLLTSSIYVPGQAAYAPARSVMEPLRDYEVVDTSKSASPELLASISGVKRRLTKDNTGTLFLLSDNGVTVVRRLRVEEEHAIQQMQNNGN